MKKVKSILLIGIVCLLNSCSEKDLLLENEGSTQIEKSTLKSSGSGWVAVTSSCSQPGDNSIFYGITNNSVNRTNLNDAANGMVGWKLVEELSDEFNYAGGKSASEFNAKWKLGYINNFSVPPTKWSGSQVTFENIGTNNRALVLKAIKSGSDLLCGMITSKAASTFPLYQEAKVKVSNSQLANAVWMISNDQGQLEEIDNLETYGPKLRSNGTVCNKPWYADKLHLSHHTFKVIGGDKKDYQPQEATWMMRKVGDCGSDFVSWKNAYHIFGVKWESANKLVYYIDGLKVKTVTAGTQGIDPNNYTAFGGLKKEMFMIISQAAQAWRYGGATQFWNSGDVISGNNTKMYIDWIKVYSPTGNLNVSPEQYIRKINQ